MPTAKRSKEPSTITCYGFFIKATSFCPSCEVAICAGTTAHGANALAYGCASIVFSLASFSYYLRYRCIFKYRSNSADLDIPFTLAAVQHADSNMQDYASKNKALVSNQRQKELYVKLPFIIPSNVSK